MTKLTPSSWVKIALIALLCLVICAGLAGCFTAVQRGVNAAMGNALHHHGAIYEGTGFPNAGDADVDADSVRSISIDWLAGEVSVFALADEACDGMVQVRETSQRGSGDVAERDRLRWNLEDGTLSIVYMNGELFNPAGLLGCANHPGKALTVAVPQSIAQKLEGLEIAAASGRYELTGVGADRLELDVASGEVSGNGLQAKSIGLNLASGRVDLEGAFSEQLDCDVMSGSVALSCPDVAPKAADIDVASGTLQLYTPANSGYTVTVDKLSGNFDCPRALSREGVYVVGDGTASYLLDMASGNVTID